MLRAEVFLMSGGAGTRVTHRPFRPEDVAEDRVGTVAAVNHVVVTAAFTSLAGMGAAPLRIERIIHRSIELSADRTISTTTGFSALLIRDSFKPLRYSPLIASWGEYRVCRRAPVGRDFFA